MVGDFCKIIPKYFFFFFEVLVGDFFSGVLLGDFFSSVLMNNFCKQVRKIPSSTALAL
jgi:hypothetical protein